MAWEKSEGGKPDPEGGGGQPALNVTLGWKKVLDAPSPQRGKSLIVTPGNMTFLERQLFPRRQEIPSVWELANYW